MAFEQDYITKLLLAYQGNITRAARAAQKDRRTFSQLIRKHEMDAQHFKRSGGPRNSHNPLLPAG
jgi:DNA-binding NtrC family response regulator